jgi:hypothetical protein
LEDSVVFINGIHIVRQRVSVMLDVGEVSVCMVFKLYFFNRFAERVMGVALFIVFVLCDNCDPLIYDVCCCRLFVDLEC